MAYPCINIFSCFVPPFCTERMRLSSLYCLSEAILTEKTQIQCATLVIEGSSEEKLTWIVWICPSFGYSYGVRVKVQIANEGFTGLKCMAKISQGREIRKTVFEMETTAKIIEENFTSLPKEFNIEITVIKHQGSTKEEIESFLENPTLLKTLCESLGKTDDYGPDLLLDPVYSDVKIKCYDLVFPAHKSILAVRSPVFAKMFETPMTEAARNEVIIEDMKASTVETMLKYLYTGKLGDDDRKDLSELLLCAEKYDIKALKANCLALMKYLLSEDNAGEFNVAVQKCSFDEETKQYFKTYCQELHCRLIKIEKFKKIFLEHTELFV